MTSPREKGDRQLSSILGFPVMRHKTETATWTHKNQTNALCKPNVCYVNDPDTSRKQKGDIKKKTLEGVCDSLDADSQVPPTVGLSRAQRESTAKWDALNSQARIEADISKQLLELQNYQQNSSSKQNKRIGKDGINEAYTLMGLSKGKKYVTSTPVLKMGVEQNSPVVEVTPVVEATPVVNSSPAVEATPVVNSSPAVEATPVVNSSPVVEATPVVEASLVVEASPKTAEKAHPQSVTVDETQAPPQPAKVHSNKRKLSNPSENSLKATHYPPKVSGITQRVLILDPNSLTNRKHAQGVSGGAVQVRDVDGKWHFIQISDRTEFKLGTKALYDVFPFSPRRRGRPPIGLRAIKVKSQIPQRIASCDDGSKIVTDSDLGASPTQSRSPEQRDLSLQSDSRFAKVAKKIETPEESRYHVEHSTTLSFDAGIRVKEPNQIPSSQLVYQGQSAQQLPVVYNPPAGFVVVSQNPSHSINENGRFRPSLSVVQSQTVPNSRHQVPYSQHGLQPTNSNLLVTQQAGNQSNSSNFVVSQQNGNQSNTNNFLISQQGANQSNTNNFLISQQGANQSNSNNLMVAQQGGGQLNSNNLMVAQQGGGQLNSNNLMVTQQSGGQLNSNNLMVTQQGGGQMNSNNLMVTQQGGGQMNSNNLMVAQQGAGQVNGTNTMITQQGGSKVNASNMVVTQLDGQGNATQYYPNQVMNSQYPAQGHQNQVMNSQYPAQGHQNQVMNPQYPAQGHQNQVMNSQYPAQGHQNQVMNSQYPAQGHQNQVMNSQYPTQGHQNQAMNSQYPAQGHQNQVVYVQQPVLYQHSQQPVQYHTNQAIHCQQPTNGIPGQVMYSQNPGTPYANQMTMGQHSSQHIANQVIYTQPGNQVVILQNPGTENPKKNCNNAS